MIRNIQMKHAGKYTCAVQTKVDSSSIATDLIVRGAIQTYAVLVYHGGPVVLLQRVLDMKIR